MLKGEENPQKENSLIKSDLFDLLEGEKAIRYFQSQSSIEEMKCKVMKQRIDQKKKQIESIKTEIKRLKNSSDKNKDHISILTRENNFLTEMINFSVSNLNK